MEPQELRLDFQKVKFYWRQTFLVPCWNKGVEIPEIQWEEYFLIAISFMFLNLVGHAASFHLDAIGRHHTQKMVNKLLGLFFLMGCPCQASAVDMGKTTALHGDTWEIQKRIDIYHYFTRVYLFCYSIFLGIATCLFFYLEEPDGWFDALGPSYRGGRAAQI